MLITLRLSTEFWVIVIANECVYLLCCSTMKERFASLDTRLKQAALVLYKTEGKTLRHVTLPLVVPQIIEAALLAFLL